MFLNYFDVLILKINFKFFFFILIHFQTKIFLKITVTRLSNTLLMLSFPRSLDPESTCTMLTLKELLICKKKERSNRQDV
jgi:hypothetical protein